MSAAPMPARSARPGWWDAVMVVYAALAALCRPLTASAAVAVLLAGAVLLGLATRRRPAQRLVCSHGAPIPWLVLAVLLAGWELTAVFWGNDRAHPTLSLLLDPVLDTYPGRFLGYLAWLAAGRWLVTR